MVTDEALAEFVAGNNLSEREVAELVAYLSSSENQSLSRVKIGPEEFVLSPHYLNSRDEQGRSLLYPEVMRCFVELNTGDYDESVMTGGIGSGKTTLCLYTVAYQLYLLSLYDNPHELFEIDPASELLFIFQSINAGVAKSVDYDRFKSMIDRSPYFQTVFPYDRSLKSEMRFPNRIIVKPVSGATTATIGQNVIGGMIDEVNFMQIIQKSARTLDGGVFDQAQQLYDGLDRRRRSRFMRQGKLPGIICLSSSKRYPGEFTDKKIEEAQREIREQGRSSIYIYDKRVWDIKPLNAFTQGWFNVFSGDAYRQPKILKPDETMSEGDGGKVVRIPEEYRKAFEQDIMNALRDIAGVSTLANYPYIIVTEKIRDCMVTNPSIFNRDVVDFDETKLRIIPENFVDLSNKSTMYFAHVDLAVTGDSVGVCVGHVGDFIEMDRGAQTETLPSIHIDGVLEVRPPPNGEVLFWKIRDIFFAIRKLGVDLRWVTYDSFQSVDSLQLLKQKGFITGVQSMDRTITPYEFLKSAIYDGRVRMPSHEKLYVELASLEKDAKKGKVDHPAHSSKDLSDALAGVVYGLTMRREVWAQHKIPITQLPPSLSGTLKPATKSA